MASADEKGWQLDTDGRVYGLHVILLKREYVLPWSQFLYAEGTSEELRVVFSTHDVIVRGTQLSSLLAHLASQQVTAIREPARADKFAAASGPRLSGLEVRRVDEEGSE